ncbi:MAG: hypothetical protein CMG57_06650 [Candidatus Marinimicrobia bacterium]|nr:hypothetical protein [Candidatus Neomarinimicrobiota bacterium]|tara:strand:- start:148 stop:813 length:666 start_codon:yes stop_codon:yes gene_type:complete
MSYEKDTKNAYRNQDKANAYKNQYIEGFKWARFTMWKQKKIIEAFINYCSFKKTDSILDAPCGAGYIGDLLSDLDSEIIASDISMEMMDLAIGEYKSDSFSGFIQSDITKLPFDFNYFKCTIVLALMHRLPKEIREEVLNEIIRVTSRYLIVSYSIESPLQQVKKLLLKIVNKNYLPAPSSLSFDTIINEFTDSNLNIIKHKRIMPFLSAKVVFLLEINQY